MRNIKITYFSEFICAEYHKNQYVILAYLRVFLFIAGARIVCANIDLRDKIIFIFPHFPQ